MEKEKEREPVYRMPLKDKGWGRLDEMIEEGSRWIQRNLREWPHGCELFPRVRKGEDGEDWLCFYFIEDEDASLF